MLRLLLLFTIVPLIELWLLLEIGKIIGIYSTIALILLTGVLGASLARWQGLLCLQTVQRQVRSGQLPTGSLLDGLGILVAAALLVTPGVLTDVVGFGLLIPPIRRIIRRAVGRYFRARITTYTSTPDNDETHDRDRIIDVQVIDSEEQNRG